jgi:hypothetical protein
MGRRQGPIPEDPEALCCLLVVNSPFTAKILYHYLKVELTIKCPCLSDHISAAELEPHKNRLVPQPAVKYFCRYRYA